MALLLSFFLLSTIYQSTFAVDCTKASNCQCNANEPCLLNCVGTDWCKGGFDLRCKTGYPCTLNCNGAQSCTDSRFIPNGATSINITCKGSNACSGNANFKCESNEPCAIQCKSGSNTCETLTLDINSASDFICSGSNCLPSFPPPFASPTIAPTFYPTKAPIATFYPTKAPTNNPINTNDPTPSPTVVPTYSPSNYPTTSPIEYPTPAPTNEPTPFPSERPSKIPSNAPSTIPTLLSSTIPTLFPTFSPTFNGDTRDPTENPTFSPVIDGQVEMITTLMTNAEIIAVKKDNDDLMSIVTIAIIIGLGFISLFFMNCLIVTIYRKMTRKNETNVRTNSLQNDNLQMEVEVNHHHIAPIESNTEEEVNDIEVENENYLSKAQKEMVVKTKGCDEQFLSKAQKQELMKTKGGPMSSEKTTIMYDNNDTLELDSHSEMYDSILSTEANIIVYAETLNVDDNTIRTKLSVEEYYEEVDVGTFETIQ